MPRVRKRNAYQRVSAFNNGLIVAYRDCGLSYHSIAARVGQDPIPISRIWNRLVQDGNMERRAGSQRSPFTSNREDRHVTRMALMDRVATSRVKNWGRLQDNYCLHEQFRRRLKHHGLSARRR
ncbi:HTH_Tnp_Tc3_2 domain-containing protein [Trichonephila clavipes]|nr:HTH_Tnp_Tc3_2 domain-containing protein [Trichonephila clavipes]